MKLKELIDKMAYGTHYKLIGAKKLSKHGTGGLIMQNESWFTDDFNRCDNCPDWDDEKGCKSHGKGCDFEGPDNECI